MENEKLDHSHHRDTGVKLPLRFLAHDIDVPMNIGSLFRIADALGVETIFLSGTSLTPPNRKIKITSRSAEKYVRWIYIENPLDAVDRFKCEGYKIVSLEMTSSSIDIREMSVAKGEKVCLVLGSERNGVSPELLAESDLTVHIPMLGKKSSMNVANACSIATFEIARKLMP